MTVFYRIIAWIATFGCFIGGLFTGVTTNDFISKYKANVKSVEYYENTFDTALPQTDIYGLVTEHFTSELPEGKTEKKCIVLGYDGCRADALSLIDGEHTSAIARLCENGGHAVISYCGGVNYPVINKQDTSTAPGWCSMLTGKWADETGITGNDIVKSNDCLTMLTTLVEDGTIDGSAFYVSWGGHFSSDDSTYYLEKQYTEEKGLNVNFLRADDDDGTKANVLADIAKADCADFIFSIFEYTDHIGHGTGFQLANGEYTDAFYDAEQTASDIIDAIEARATYDTEDWLIIITSDHGGFASWHGGPTMMERYTFIATNKEIEIPADNSGRIC